MFLQDLIFLLLSVFIISAATGLRDDSMASTSAEYTDEYNVRERKEKDSLKITEETLLYLNDKADNVKPAVEVYYESLCPYSREFYSVYLSQMVEALHPYVNVSTYPFGNAMLIKHYDGNYTIECQFGRAECYGNRLHACAIDIIKNNTVVILYTGCMMQEKFQRGSDDAAAEECGQDMKIDSKQVDEIKECAKEKRGQELAINYGKISIEVGFRYVPYVLINGVEWDGDSADEFFKAVCDAFKNPPEECKQRQ